jgi:uncharacterized protein HemY
MNKKKSTAKEWIQKVLKRDEEHQKEIKKIPRAVKMSKKGKLLKSTDNALEWFPELKQLFENFEIAHIKIRLKNTTDYFAIVGDEE